MHTKPAFGAYPEGEPQKTVSYSFKVSLVAADCLLLGLQPVLVHLSKNKDGKFSFNPVSVNFMTELTKTIIAFIVLLFVGTGRSGVPMYRSLRSFIRDAHHNRLLAVPAGLYAVNNYLKFTMQLYFKPVTTKMLGNLKIFTIALLMRTVMNRQFNVIQWEALFLLVAGITVNQLSSCSTSSAPAPPFLPAALCTAGTITVPSMASVYNEFALKKNMDTSVHLQNFFLYFFGAVFNLLGMLGICLLQRKPMSQLFAHQSPVTLMLIINNAAQGILSSFFFKFADTILKKYSSTIATIFTALMSFLLFSHPLTVNFALGVSIVFISMHQFFTFGPKKVATGTTVDLTASAAAFKPAISMSNLKYSPSFDHVQVAVQNEGYVPREAAKLLLPR